MPRGLERRAEMFTAVAAAWKNAGLTFAVLHGAEDYPRAIGRDLDVFIPRRHVKQAMALARAVFADQGCQVATPPNLWGSRVVAADPADPHGWNSTLEIHALVRLNWRHVVLADQPCPVADGGPFPTDPWATFAKRILLPVLSGDLRRFLSRPKELSLTQAEMTAVKRLSAVAGRGLAGVLLNSVVKNDLDTIKALAPKLGRAIAIRGLRHPLLALQSGLASFIRWARLPFTPCAPIVGIVGPDGVGKSTLVRLLAEGDRGIFVSVVLRHWRPSVLPRMGALLGRRAPAPNEGGLFPPRRKPGRVAWARALYYWLDYQLGYFLRDRVASARQKLVLYDRCALDMAVDPVRYGLHSGMAARWLAETAPAPDLVVLLYDEPERIYMRKPELSVTEIEEQLAAWNKLLRSRRGTISIRIDDSPAAMAERVRQHILDAFMSKNRERSSGA